METGRPDAPFEVYCGRCRVTFPGGTRRCIHCGGPTGPSREVAAAVSSRLRRAPEPGADAGGLEEDPEELVRPRTFSPLTLLWIALVIGGYAMRSCTGQ